MKKLLILCLHRPNRSPSQRFRFEQYLDYLCNNGYEIRFSFLLSEKQDKAFYQPGNYMAKLRIVLLSIFRRAWESINIKSYDLIFVQREVFMLGTPFFERIMASKVPMIFDFDDSIWLQNVSEANKNLSFLKDASKTSKIIEKAALVFAGNPYLADYAKQFNQKVVIVPTTIDLEVYQNTRPPKNENDPVCIGWSGSFTTIEHFQTAIPVLQKIKLRYGAKVSFKIIGDGNYYCKELETKGQAWNAATEVEELSKIDIGIMPLPDTEWAKGKCGLKGLQYMALGIPTLMSPVGVNSSIIGNGVNGYLPGNEEQWVTYLSTLIENKAMREQIGEAGKRTVVEKYSVDAWKKRYVELFNAVAK